MTRAEFLLKLRGYYRKEAMKWEHTRQVCYTIAANAFGRKKRMPTPQAWWPLPTDERYKIKTPNSEMKKNWELLKKNESKTSNRD